MMRRVQIVVGIVLSLICTGAAVAEGAAHLPTLGSARYAKAIGGASPGFGTVAPKVVNANGDPGSVVYDLRWAGWGRAQAVGNGKSYAPGTHGGWSGTLVPHGGRRPARIHAIATARVVTRQRCQTASATSVVAQLGQRD